MSPGTVFLVARKFFPFGTLTNKDFIPSITNFLPLKKVPRVMKACFH